MFEKWRKIRQAHLERKNSNDFVVNLNDKNFGSEVTLLAPTRPQHTTAGQVIRSVVRNPRERHFCHSLGTAIVWRGNKRMQSEAILLLFMGKTNFTCFKCSCVFAFGLGPHSQTKTSLSPSINGWDTTAVCIKGSGEYVKSKQIRP